VETKSNPQFQNSLELDRAGSPRLHLIGYFKEDKYDAQQNGTGI
jgi:hypothetical protein